MDHKNSESKKKGKPKVKDALETPETGSEQQQAEAPETVQMTKEEYEKVKAHIESLVKEKDGAVDTAQRLQADFDNYRKRNSTLRADSYDEGVRDCMRAILPTLDNFDRAFDNAADVDPAFVEGVRLVQRNLIDALGKLGLKEIDASGTFDANFHHAVMQAAEDGKKSGDIIEVFQKGYEANGKILRHSMVKVAE